MHILASQDVYVLHMSGFGCEDLTLGLRAAGCLMQYVADTQMTAVPHIRGLSRELRDDALESLVEVVDLLQSEPDKLIRIEGHTDSTGNEEANLRISQQRADAVLEALVSLGVEADRVTSIGMGQDFPIASNDTEEGRAQNRRVDVILLDG